MSFSSRKYKFILIFSDSIKNKEPWDTEAWLKYYEPLFRKLVNLSPLSEKTGIKVLEYERKDDNNGRLSEMKLGRLQWNEKSHQKWTFSDRERVFSHFESWTPIWTVCEKQDKAPDIYISFWNEKMLGRKENLQFDLFFTVAIAEDLAIDVKDIIIEIVEQFEAKIAVVHNRTWGRGKRDENRMWNFVNWIQDTASFGIYKSDKSANIHDIKFDEINFEPYWDIIYKK